MFLGESPEGDKKRLAGINTKHGNFFSLSCGISRFWADEQLASASDSRTKKHRHDEQKPERSKLLSN